MTALRPKKFRRLRRRGGLADGEIYVPLVCFVETIFASKLSKMKYIRQGVLFEVAPTLEEFSITWASADGHWVHEDRAVCTSMHAEGDTMNIKSLITGQISTVILDTIKEFAGKEVVL